MTHIGDSLVPLQGSLQQVEETTTVEIDQNAINKATLVLRTLRAAGIKQPFDFNIDDAARLWAAQIGGFSSGILNDAVAECIADPGGEWPTLGEFETICQQILTENMRKSAEADAKARNPEGRWCEECGVQDEDHPEHGFIRGYNVRYIRVEDEPSTIVNWKGVTVQVPNHHMRPCSLCLPDSYELYMANHFTADHRSRGGCKECRDYMPGHKATKKPAGRIG